MQNVPTTLAPPIAPTTNAPPTPVQPAECKPVPTRPAQLTQKYVVRDAPNGTVCLLAEFSSTIFLNTTTPGQYIDLGKGTLNTTNSKCDSTTGTASLVVDFECGQVQFKVSGTQTVAVEDIHGFYNTTISNIKKHYIFHHEQPIFNTTKTGFYYRCNSDQYISLDVIKPPLSPEPVPTGVSLLLSNLGFDAFGSTNSEDFYKPAEVCSLDSGPVNDLVPIAVGACLAALVVIVLIAYFVGRRRWSERSTYESV